LISSYFWKVFPWVLGDARCQLRSPEAVGRSLDLSPLFAMKLSGPLLAHGLVGPVGCLTLAIAQLLCMSAVAGL
jgi:hypothetical protein